MKPPVRRAARVEREFEETSAEKPAPKASAKGKAKAKAIEEDNSAVLAEFCTTLLGNIASTAWQKEAHLNNQERANVEKPLASILERLDRENLEKASILVQPIMLVIGLAGWYLRVRPKEADDSSGGQPPKQNPPAPVPTNGNGVVRRDLDNLAVPVPPDIERLWRQS